METTLNVNGRMYRAQLIQGAMNPQQVETAARSRILQTQGCSCGAKSGVMKLGTATCPTAPIALNSTHTLTGNVISGGTPPFTYTWTITPPAGSPVTLTGASQTYQFTQTGAYTVTMTLTDSCPQGAKTDSATCQVTVQAVVTTGSIACTSTPSGAQLWLDGVNTNLFTPFTLTNVPAGTHTVIFRLSGYQDCSQIVTVTAGATANAACTLSQTCVQPGCGFTMTQV